MRRPRYSQFDKRCYLTLCRHYNSACENIGTEDGKNEFINLSLHLHRLSGSVPKTWRTPSFVRNVGTGNQEIMDRVADGVMRDIKGGVN